MADHTPALQERSKGLRGYFKNAAVGFALLSTACASALTQVQETSLSGDLSESAMDQVTSTDAELHATQETIDSFGTYEDAIMQHVPDVAGKDIIVMTPNDLIEPGETVVRDHRIVEMMGEEEALRRAQKVREVLESIPNLNYSGPALPTSHTDPVTRDQASEIQKLSYMYAAVLMGNSSPMTLSFEVAPNTSLIVMPDEADYIKDLIEFKFPSLEAYQDGFPSTSPEDWYLLVLLHEAAHVYQISQADITAYSQLDWDLQSLLRETGADVIAMEKYFSMINDHGIPLDPTVPHLQETWRAIGTLLFSDVFNPRGAGLSVFNDHATNSLYDVVGDTVIDEPNVSDNIEATAAALTVNTMALELLYSANPTMGMNGAYNLLFTKPLMHYAAVNYLVDNNYFQPGSAEYAIATEYLDAMEQYIPTADIAFEVEILEKRLASFNGSVLTSYQIASVERAKQQYIDAAEQASVPDVPFFIIPDRIQPNQGGSSIHILPPPQPLRPSV